jgi:hypothetical protein
MRYVVIARQNGNESRPLISLDYPLIAWSYGKHNLDVWWGRDFHAGLSRKEVLWSAAYLLGSILFLALSVVGNVFTPILSHNCHSRLMTRTTLVNDGWPRLRRSSTATRRNALACRRAFCTVVLQTPALDAIASMWREQFPRERHSSPMIRSTDSWGIANDRKLLPVGSPYNDYV